MVSSTHEAARRCLLQCLERQPDRFAKLFSCGTHCKRHYGVDLEPLIELGIIDLSAHEVSVLVPIIPFQKLFIKCDAPDLCRWNRVFPVHDDESALLARWADVRPNDVVLDIGTGSGIVALTAASAGAEKVIATDINPKVRDYLTFNAQLNGLMGRIEYLESDLFTSLDGEHFDVITCNPPFVPVPREAEYFLHSDGGPLGTVILERLFREFRHHLRPQGRLFAMALSLTIEFTPRIAAFFPQARLTTIYDDNGAGLTDIFAPFAQVPGFQTWRDQIVAAPYDGLGYFGVTWGQSSYAAGERLRMLIKRRLLDNDHGAWPELSWSMKARSKRYHVPGSRRIIKQ